MRRKTLLVFIHGFKGDDETFQSFPNDLVGRVPKLNAESIVYPRYETRGDLQAARDAFCEWLEKIVRNRKEQGPECEVFVFLLGHSMGGILGAEVLIKYADEFCAATPNVLGLLAFDTPYYGVNDQVFAKAAYDRATVVTEKVTAAYSLLSGASGLFSKKTTTTTTASIRNVSAASGDDASKSTTSGGIFDKWKTTLAVGGAVVAAGTAAYVHRDKLEMGMGWVGSHLEFVSVLFKDVELKRRVNRLLQIPATGFHCYYTMLQPKNNEDKPRTFIHKPPEVYAKHFSPVPSNSHDEIDAHITMFDDKTRGYNIFADSVARRLNDIVSRRENAEY